MWYKICAIGSYIFDNLATILLLSFLGFGAYSLYQDFKSIESKEKALEERYGKEYFNSWHSWGDKEPTKLTHVKGLEDCIYVVMELTRNDTRHVIRCKNDAQVTVPGKFPKTTALVN